MITRERGKYVERIDDLGTSTVTDTVRALRYSYTLRIGRWPIRIRIAPEILERLKLELADLRQNPTHVRAALEGVEITSLMGVALEVDPKCKGLVVE